MQVDFAATPEKKLQEVPAGSVVRLVSRYDNGNWVGSTGGLLRLRFKPFVGGVAGLCGAVGARRLPLNDGDLAEDMGQVEDDGAAFYTPVAGTVEVVAPSGVSATATVGVQVRRAEPGECRATWTLTHQLHSFRTLNIPVQRGAEWMCFVGPAATTSCIFSAGTTGIEVQTVAAGVRAPVPPGTDRLSIEFVHPPDIPALLRFGGRW